MATLGSENTSNRLLDEFSRISANYLVHTKGYELAALQAGTSTTSSKAMHEDSENHVRVLLSWAAESPDGADPPDKVVAGAKTLGDLANVDGILLLQGWGKALSDEAILTVILTASLAWPILIAGTKVSLSADLYEVSSGRIVWRSRATSNNADHLYDLRGSTPRPSTETCRCHGRLTQFPDVARSTRRRDRS